METRKITVISTRDQKKSVIMSAATTLAELKTDLSNNYIDYTDMTFFEGTSKTELLNDSSILPHDVPYKGQITNELVFMLTSPNKKIKSGASQRNLWATIRELNLQDACKEMYGRNYTNCSKEQLEELINKYSKNGAAIPEASPEYIVFTGVDTKAREAILLLIDLLGGQTFLDDSEKIRDLIQNKEGIKKHASQVKEELKSSYASDEIDDMFNFINN